MNDEALKPLTADEAHEDLRQLVDLLVNSHPDPFTGCGGMISFYRLADNTARAIPDSGLTAIAFLRLLRPLVAAVRDGHTTIFDPKAPDQKVDARALAPDAGSQPRLWIDWEPVDERLVVAAVYEEGRAQLIGMRLESIEGVSFDELADRMRGIRGDDNVYNNLVHLAEALAHPTLIFDLLECPAAREVTIDLTDALGQLHRERFALRREPLGDRQAARSAIELASPGPTRIGWQPVGDEGEMMLLRVGPMMWYREAFEVWRHYGFHHNLTHHLDELLLDIGVDPRPQELDERIARVPSAGQIFVEMLEEMDRTGIGTLIVDLRDSTGGNSTIAGILQYVLFGIDAMAQYDGGYQVRRLSPLFFENNRNLDDRVSARLIGGYDFSEERARNDVDDGVSQASILKEAAASPSFARLIEDYPYRPARDLKVIVVTSARTYSAGFDMAAMLYKHGATVVGVPSSQAGQLLHRYIALLAG